LQRYVVANGRLLLATLATIFATLALVFAQLTTIFADLATTLGQLGLGHDVELHQDAALLIDRWRIKATHQSPILALQGAQPVVVHRLAPCIPVVISGIPTVITQVAAIIGSPHRLTAPHVPTHFAPTAAYFSLAARGLCAFLPQLAVGLCNFGR
jgi:hypothetical protein